MLERTRRGALPAHGHATLKPAQVAEQTTGKGQRTRYNQSVARIEARPATSPGPKSLVLTSVRNPKIS